MALLGAWETHWLCSYTGGNSPANDWAYDLLVTPIPPSLPVPHRTLLPLSLHPGPWYSLGFLRDVWFLSVGKHTSPFVGWNCLSAIAL